MVTLNRKTLVLLATGLFVAFVIATILFFNARPEPKRVTDTITTPYAVTDEGFKRETGILTGGPWVDGNDLTIYDRGSDIFEAMHEDIRTATESIHKETFNYYGEDVGRPMAEALAAAAERGVEVRFVMDYLGSALASGEKLELMQEAGVEVVRWRQPAWYQLAHFNHRTHRKLLITDGTTAFTGGANTADPWLPAPDDGGYKDYHFRLHGPIVGQLQGAFSHNWVYAENELLSGSQYYPPLDSAGPIPMQVTTSHPIESRQKVRKMLLYAMAAATESIRIGSAYFFPDDRFLNSMKHAAARGVEVTLLTPGEQIDQNYVRKASRTLFGSLLEAGVHIYEYQPTMYHAKLMVVDEHFVTMGSTNFDNRSFRLNDEANVNILHEETGREMATRFDADLENAERITQADLDNRSTWDRLYGWLVARVLGPYL